MRRRTFVWAPCSLQEFGEAARGSEWCRCVGGALKGKNGRLVSAAAAARPLGHALPTHSHPQSSFPRPRPPPAPPHPLPSPNSIRPSVCRPGPSSVVGLLDGH